MQFVPRVMAVRVAPPWSCPTTTGSSTTSSRSTRQAVRPWALSDRRHQADHARSAGGQPPLLQHPSAHGGLHRRGGQPLLRHDRRGRRVHHPRRAARRYTYHAWRSGAETISGTVTVGEGQPLEVAGHDSRARLRALVPALLPRRRWPRRRRRLRRSGRHGRTFHRRRARRGTQARVFGDLPRTGASTPRPLGDTWGDLGRVRGGLSLQHRFRPMEVFVEKTMTGPRCCGARAWAATARLSASTTAAITATPDSCARR